MLKEFINWFRQKTNLIFPKPNFVEAQAAPKPSSNVKKNKYYLVDAMYPALIADKDVPVKTLLPMRSIGESTGGFPLGTIQQQAMGIKQLVNNALIYLQTKSPRAISKWSSVQSLTLNARAGQEANAYYDRSSLKFFFFSDNNKKKMIYTSDSSSIVLHEFGHAFLDLLRPDLWSVQAVEIWAFHEAFGDMCALLNNMNEEALLDKAMLETEGDLYKSNCLSRMGQEMGVAIYFMTGGKSGELKNAIRDMSIPFKYTEPERLPSNGRDDVLINESHSFSRVFASMFYNLILAVSAKYMMEGQNKKQAFISTRDILAKYLLQAICSAPITKRFYKAVCQEMLLADQRNGSKFQKIMNDVFINFRIMKPTIAVLNSTRVEELVANLSVPYELDESPDATVLRLKNNKTIKLADIFTGVSALSNNPLVNAEIEIATESAYYFDANGNMYEAEESTFSETINDAYECVKYLNDKGLVGSHDSALFEVIDNKLVRKQIACGCNKPNYCIKGAPEYQKPWKPANNAGCVKCQKTNCQPRPCDCAAPETPKPPKLGCFTKVGGRGITSYTVGSKISRRVC